MKKVFSKKDFPPSPDGNIYQWHQATTEFNVPEKDQYVIAITASAKNGQQNNSRDDDDLRVIIDGFEFGTQEIHEGKISWKGFGTTAAWDGASLKGGTKTVYFFMELSDDFVHQIKFEADVTPSIKEVTVWQLDDLSFELNQMKPTENVDVDTKGVPWMSFVFTGARPEKIDITAHLKKTTKEESDGDNIKVVVNGEILQNLPSPTSKKYKNLYFSGDLTPGESKLLLDAECFEFHENAVELWYDQTPEIKKLTITLNSAEQERRESIIKDTPLQIEIAENENIDSNDPWYELASFEDVSDYKALYEKYAKKYDIDPNLVKSIAYLETTHGYYDVLFAIVNRNSSILPMNINPIIWEKMEENETPIAYDRKDLKDPDKNIHLGVLLLKRIWERVKNPTVMKVATLYQNLNALKVSDYGARVKKIYDEKLFE